MNTVRRALLTVFAALAIAGLPALAVADVKINSFTASPTKNPVVGGPIKLDWNVTGAPNVTLDGIVVPAVGSQTFDVQTSHTFYLVAQSADGRTSSKVGLAVQIMSGTIQSFTATPVPGSPGDFKLDWVITGSSAAFIDMAPPFLPLTGSRVVHPTSPHTYVLTAMGAGSLPMAVTKSVTVTP